MNFLGNLGDDNLRICIISFESIIETGIIGCYFMFISYSFYIYGGSLSLAVNGCSFSQFEEFFSFVVLPYIYVDFFNAGLRWGVGKTVELVTADEGGAGGGGILVNGNGCWYIMGGLFIFGIVTVCLKLRQLFKNAEL